VSLDLDHDATPPSSLRSQWGVALVVVGASLLCGVVLGLLWLWIAPTATIDVTDHGAFLGEGAGGRLIADDGWFAVLGAVAGVVGGAVGWWRLRAHMLGLAAGIVVGGLLGGLAAWWTGLWLGPASLVVQAVGAQPGDVLQAPLSVRAPAVLFVAPIAALIVIFGLTAGADREPTGATERSFAHS
jgi:hypothetical protein